jgi:hypothetical protein
MFLGHSKQPPFWDWSAPELEQQIASLEQSRSWKWTTPFRSLDRLFRRFK